MSVHAGATLVQMLATHPGLAELLKQFRGRPAFQAPTNLTNHISPAQIRAHWPPWASRPTAPPAPALQPRPAITHLGKRTPPTPFLPSPNPTGMNGMLPAALPLPMGPRPAAVSVANGVASGHPAKRQRMEHPAPPALAAGMHRGVAVPPGHLQSLVS